MILALALLSSLCSFAAAEKATPKYHSPAEKQNKLHEIADLAREIGLPEDSPIIVEAKRVCPFPGRLFIAVPASPLLSVAARRGGFTFPNQAGEYARRRRRRCPA